MDLKNISLHTPIHRPEYIKVPLKYFSDDIIKQYSLEPLQYNAYIYIEMKKGIYRLKQVSVLAYQNLSILLTDGGYEHILG